MSSSPSCGALVVPQIPVYIDDLQPSGWFIQSHTSRKTRDYEFDMYLTSQPTEDVHVSSTKALPPGRFDGDRGERLVRLRRSRRDVDVFKRRLFGPGRASSPHIGDDAARGGDVTFRTTARAVSNDASYHELASRPNVTGLRAPTRWDGSSGTTTARHRHPAERPERHGAAPAVARQGTI